MPIRKSRLPFGRRAACLLGALLMIASWTLPARADDGVPDEISFGIIATERSGAMRKMWEPFLEDMEKAIGRKVRGFYATDYAAMVEAMRFHKVQVAWFGNKSAIDAVDRANGEVFAQFVDADGAPGYYSYIICRKDSSIGSLDELLRDGKRYTFGVGDPDSLSGTLVPAFYVFQQRHIDLRNHFKAVRSSNHEGNFLGVLAGQVDAATSNSEMLQKIQDTQPAKADQIRILWKSEPLPRDPLVWDRSLPEDVKKPIRSFILGYGKNDREKAILHGMYHLAGFRASDNSQLAVTRDLFARVDRRAVR
jgi:phosphonate transport system substrate-binding protein